MVAPNDTAELDRVVRAQTKLNALAFIAEAFTGFQCVLSSIACQNSLDAYDNLVKGQRM